VLKPAVEHGKLTATVSCYVVKKNMPVHTLKAYVGGLEVQLHLSLTMALDRGEWLASRPGHFTPGKESQSPDPVWTFDAYVVS
jgi:hypothetical protein